MRFKSIAFMAMAAVVAVAPQAFAFGSSSHSGPVSGFYTGTSTGGTLTGSAGGASVSGTYSGGTTGGSFGGTYTLSAAEPLSAFAVGLGLLGARYLRRRK